MPLIKTFHNKGAMSLKIKIKGTPLGKKCLSFFDNMKVLAKSVLTKKPGGQMDNFSLSYSNFKFSIVTSFRPKARLPSTNSL